MESDYSKKELLILPFDHRTSFIELLGITGRSLNRAEKKQISEYKRVVYEGFKIAIENGVPKETAGILVDEEFGADIAHEAKDDGYILAMPAEKSGQQEFDFEYGDAFKEHIEAFDPTYVKVLVRFNPEGDRNLNMRQTKCVKTLSDYLHKTGRQLLFELLIPPTPEQMLEVGESRERYDSEIRPKLVVVAMRELQEAGIDPTVWKVEGFKEGSVVNALVKQAREGGRKADVIILGRGENKARVQDWLKTAAQTPGVIGFAVGRTVFLEPLLALKNREISRETAIETIAKNFLELVYLWRTTGERLPVVLG